MDQNTQPNTEEAADRLDVTYSGAARILGAFSQSSDFRVSSTLTRSPGKIDNRRCAAHE